MRIVPDSSIHVPNGMGQFTGHYFSYLPMEDRCAIGTYFDEPSSSSAEETDDDGSIVWFHYKSVAEYNKQRLRSVYGVNCNKVDSRDKSVRVDSTLSIVTNEGRVSKYKVERVGVPIDLSSLESMYNLGYAEEPVDGRAHFKCASSMAQCIAMSRQVYAMTQIASASQRIGNDSEKTATTYFMRVLEDGTFVKLHVDKDHRLEHLHWCIKIILDMERKSNVESAQRFNEICRNVLKRLYETLNDSKRVSTEASVLIRIFRDTYEYADMTVSYRDVPTKARTDIGNSKLSACKCAVGGCKMFPNLSEGVESLSSDAEMCVLFKQSVDNRSVRARRSASSRQVDDDDDDDEDSAQQHDLAYNFCKKHGRLVACTWYLLNQQKIWTYDFYRELSIHNRGKISLFNTNAEALHQFFLNNEDVLNKYKRRAESAIMYVENYMAMVKAGMSAVQARNRM